MQVKAGKQALGDDERLRRLFTSLCAQIDGGHMLNAIKTCDKILRINPADPDAHKTKLFLLLQTEQYETALPLIDAVHDPFQLAYTLYRLQREEDALRVLGPSDDRASTHLRAQMSYRTGSYAHAVELYTQLLGTADPESEEHADILTNLRAAQAHYDFVSAGYLHALGALPASLASILSAPPTGAGRGPAAPAQHEHEHEPRAPKKPRAKRVPPGVVPGVTPPPDPERWLKKSERTSVPGKRRKAQGGGVTQGSVATSEMPPAVEAKVKAKARKRK